METSRNPNPVIGGKLSEEKLRSIFARLKRPQNANETKPPPSKTEVRFSTLVSETAANVTVFSSSTITATSNNQHPFKAIYRYCNIRNSTAIYLSNLLQISYTTTSETSNIRKFKAISYTTTSETSKFIKFTPYTSNFIQAISNFPQKITYCNLLLKPTCSNSRQWLQLKQKRNQCQPPSEDVRFFPTPTFVLSSKPTFAQILPNQVKNRTLRISTTINKP